MNRLPRCTGYAPALSLALGAAGLFTTTSAGAQGFVVDGNSVPHAPEDLLWTERPAIPMDHLSVFGRAMMGYAKDPLVVTDETTGEETALIESQYNFYLSAGVALFNQFHVSAMVPFVAQRSATQSGGLDPSGFALGNPIIDVRATILPVGSVVELGIGAGLGIPVGDSEALAADETVSAEGRMSVGKSFGEEARSFVALNSGVRFRAAQTLGNVSVGHELTFGAGVNWAFLPRSVAKPWKPLSLLAELTGSTTLSDAFEPDSTPVGLLFGLRYAPKGWSAAAGVGPGISQGYGTPDVRALSSLGARINRKEEQEQPVAKAQGNEKDPCSDASADPKNCPAKDADADGIKNSVDQCPIVKEDFDGFEDDDGCPEQDNDKDGVFDADDSCPLLAEDLDGFKDEDGCPDGDNDGDKIADALDQCPQDPETQNGHDDLDGCPDHLRVMDGQIMTLEPLYFVYGKAEIDPRSEQLLLEMSSVINRRAELGVISIEGHTDSQGADRYNMDLSKRRAESVRKFLVDAGVSPERLIAEGFGETRPLLSGESAAAMARNRRVEFRFHSTQGDSGQKETK